MAKNRKAFIDQACADLDLIYPGGGFGKVMRQALERLTVTQFEAYIARLRNGIAENPDLDHPRELLTLVVPNMAKVKLSIENNFAVAKKWGFKFDERIWITDPVTGDTYLSNRPYIVFDLPVSRQAQTLDEKISVPKNNRHVDDRTNQPTGASKASALSYPETQILLSNNLKSTATELLKFRGGDELAFRHMNKDIQETSTFKQTKFDDVDTKAKAATVAGIYLKAMHMDNNM